MKRLVVSAFLSLLPGTAFADDIATDEDVCSGREAGTACNFDGGRGFCRKSTCNGLDYSDGKPKTVERECMKCLPEQKVGETNKAESKSETKTEAKTDAPEAKAEPTPEAKAEPTPPEAKTEPEAKTVPAATSEPTKATVSETKTAPASTAPPAQPATKSCAVDPMPASFGSIALGVALLVLARRRRP